MFRKQSPEAFNNQGELNFQEVVASLVNLSIEDINKRCELYDDSQLEATIHLHHTFISQPEKIELYFQNTIGYPSREAAIRGIHAYATGEVRKLGEDISKQTRELTKSIDALLGRQPNPPKKLDLEEERTKETLLSTTENLAKLYILLNNAKAKLESNLIGFRSEFIRRQEQNKTQKSKSPNPAKQ